ncbi:hypothetical protein HCN44_002490 [Aphidius gifuensis]|uniref:Uncharacterized protein n=1 Tax=Aphidius gifuensis TaxID=684658 RepID=A0A835CV43_APHGI|nr:uncharacterized protein LOC122860903 [Aphidius gifuensis]XP_044020898.1 uncharacterized protein LOC122860903 [Aphidius gifuensis]KAF7996844.1 hypothetical protein HCN44_002490 [Aphidius gifuensis]
MTLHWWMHWFWVTANIALIIAMPSTTQEPHVNRDKNLMEKPMFIRITTKSPDIKISISQSTITTMPLFKNNRNAKAINPYEPSKIINREYLAGPDIIKDTIPNSSKPYKYRPTTTTSTYQYLPTKTVEIYNNPSKIRTIKQSNIVNIQRDIENIEEIQNDSPDYSNKKDQDEQDEEEIIQTRQDTRILWIIPTTTTTKTTTSNYPTRRRSYDVEKNNKKITINNNDGDDGGDDLSVLPIRLEETELKVVVNTSRMINGDSDTLSFSSQTVNRSEDIEIESPKILSQTSSSPVLQASIEEYTRERLNRARLSSEFKNIRNEGRSFIGESLDRIDDIDDTVRGESELIGNYQNNNNNKQFTTLDIAAIGGSFLAMAVLISSMASFGFLMYRKKYLNPPQTLNSDKCSNPDSSGYIDDSTIRDNSEEMYSLDNDSFLNSLEAMTIQNYWTDSVKHTKL